MGLTLLVVGSSLGAGVASAAPARPAPRVTVSVPDFFGHSTTATYSIATRLSNVRGVTCQVDGVSLPSCGSVTSNTSKETRYSVVLGNQTGGRHVFSVTFQLSSANATGSDPYTVTTPTFADLQTACSSYSGILTGTSITGSWGCNNTVTSPSQVAARSAQFFQLCLPPGVLNEDWNDTNNTRYGFNCVFG